MLLTPPKSVGAATNPASVLCLKMDEKVSLQKEKELNLTSVYVATRWVCCATFDMEKNENLGLGSPGLAWPNLRSEFHHSK